ncbi:hypothetical protein RHGRI_018848 [Rhododendron griersonianum]|uniref:Methyltransferase domain-containing protein n=1 Tax=Rhododendron griersonianum TaxID=479676 RepID=A0AAV6K351_9ERIC|nr:hypothetical protein RHGRI_018848 [Rhododendron griersonianum]
MSAVGIYSCETATQTLEWIHAIIDFLKPFSFFSDALVVNFFKDRLWEAVDKEWMDCLRNEPVEYLLQIPSGVVQDYWPASLKKFILTSRSLAFPREQADLQKVLPGLHLRSLNNVIAQGMNQKKKHEIEALAAIISSIARSVGAGTVVDVGAGQGYLAQVLSFECQLSVIAIDACSHHGRITDARAERIKKYYAAKMRKSREKMIVSNQTSLTKLQLNILMGRLREKFLHLLKVANVRCFLLDFMPVETYGCVRTFVECDEVKAVVSIGCCYNLLSEGGTENVASQCGFPMSKGVNDAGLLLGKSSRDLACQGNQGKTVIKCSNNYIFCFQSAERWSSLGKDAGLHNFELHAFRAAFQMVFTAILLLFFFLSLTLLILLSSTIQLFSILKVLFRYYPEILTTSPRIGRQGKAFRRQQNQRILESHLQHESTGCPNSLSRESSMKKGNCPTMKSSEAGPDNNKGAYDIDTCIDTLEYCGTADLVGSAWGNDGSSHVSSSNQTAKCGEVKPIDKISLFEKFSQSGLHRLGLSCSNEIDFTGLWKETEPFSELIGPYWSLRAALGPVFETIVLLDRLLFLQEQDKFLEAYILPIFDPVLSPRNVALIAKKF